MLVNTIGCFLPGEAVNATPEDMRQRGSGTIAFLASDPATSRASDSFLKGTTMSTTNRRSFLARGAALAAVPAVASLTAEGLTGRASADTLPDYAPIPLSALGPAVNEQGYFVGRVEKNLYWVTDSAYQAAFLTTRDGVVLFDAPRRSGTTCSAPSTRSPPKTGCRTR